jgi:tRNA modification GTPase
MHSENDTIAAIATAPGQGGIAVVRVSGKKSFALADAVFRGKGPKPSQRPGGTFVRGFAHAASGEKMDEVILLVYRRPHSYTREDAVEFQCHGGAVCARRILQALVDAGARPAEPGEFTKRAFLNGRLDLIQAEAVADLVRAGNDRAASAALEQLRGSLTASLTTIYDGLILALSDLEAMLDFPDDETPPIRMEEIVSRLRDTRARTSEMLATWNQGRMLREGAVVAICGQPNVGKSTLLNCLLGTDRAIVTDIPGTTRDTIEEQISIEGFPVRLVDTAGLRDATSPVEAEGVRRATRTMEGADLVLYVVDASRPLDKFDAVTVKELGAERALVILNKCDLGSAVSGSDLGHIHSCRTVAVRGEGVTDIRKEVSWILGLLQAPENSAMVSERHRALLSPAIADLDEAMELLETCREDLMTPAASLVTSAAESIGRVLGRVHDADLLDAVFKRFCVGK